MPDTSGDTVAHHPSNQMGKRLTPSELQAAVQAQDHVVLSREGSYALEKRDWLRSDSQRNRPDRVAREESLSGTLDVTTKYVLADLKTGRGVNAGARKGLNQVRIGREERRRQCQERFDALRRQHPRWSYTELSKQAGKALGCDERTVRRYCKNPNPRRSTT